MKRLLQLKFIRLSILYALCITQLLFLFASFPVLAQKLTASDGSAQDFFGSAVSVCGDWAFIGSPYSSSMTGAVYIFHFNGSNWQEVDKLTGSYTNNEFGYSVKVDGDVAIVGAPFFESKGGAYIYRLSGSTWKLEATLRASDGMLQDFFGYSVSIKNNVALVSAINDLNVTGTVYFFENSGTSWVERANFTATEALPGDKFGFNIDLNNNGSEVIVGCRGASYTGAAFIFKKTGALWTKFANLTVKYPQFGDYFGSSVDMNGDLAAVSARFDSYLAKSTGAAHIFRRSGNSWKYEARLAPFDGIENDRFGRPEIINNNTIVIGASHNDDDGLDAGCAYIYRWDGTEWLEAGKLYAPDGFPGKGYGLELSSSGSRLIVGAPYDNDKGSNSGAAYIVDLSSLPTPSLPVLRQYFDGQTFPPDGWTRKVLNNTATWAKGSIIGPAPFTMHHPDNKYSALCNKSTNNQDEWLITPKFDLPSGESFLRFFSGYNAKTITAAGLSMHISTDNGNNWTQLWEAEDDGGDWIWRERVFNLKDYSGNQGLLIGFRYSGVNGDPCGIDGVVIWSKAAVISISDDERKLLPDKYSLIQNYPNPFNAQTKITIQIPNGSFVDLKVYDMLGRVAAHLINEYKEAGTHEIIFSAGSLPSGSYICFLRAGIHIEAKKMIILK